MTKRVHKIDIAFKDEIINWYLDEDFASYLNLVSGLSQCFLGDDYGQRSVKVLIHACLSDGDDCFPIKDDASLWKMFRLNTNVEDIIRLVVEFKEVTTISPSPRKTKGVVIFEDEDDSNLDEYPGFDKAMTLVPQTSQTELVAKELFCLPPPSQDESVIDESQFVAQLLVSQDPGFEGLEQDEGEKVPENAAHAQDHVREEPNEENGDFLVRLNPEDIGA